MVHRREEILDARVPILKLVERETRVEMDIAFNVLDGFKAVQPIKALIAKYPPLKPLVLVVKAFLRERRLNETYRGGIGSFLLVLLTTAFLQQLCKENKDALAKTTLGMLLIKFFRFYGYDFNHEELGISIVGEGGFYPKPDRGSPLCVENPQDMTSIIGKSVRQYGEIVRAFQHAADKLLYTTPSLSAILHPFQRRKKKKAALHLHQP